MATVPATRLQKLEFPGASVLAPAETVERLAAELRTREGVQLVVAFSNLSGKANSARQLHDEIDSSIPDCVSQLAGRIGFARALRNRNRYCAKAGSPARTVHRNLHVARTGTALDGCDLDFTASRKLRGNISLEGADLDPFARWNYAVPAKSIRRD